MSCEKMKYRRGPGLLTLIILVDGAAAFRAPTPRIAPRPCRPTPTPLAHANAHPPSLRWCRRTDSVVVVRSHTDPSDGETKNSNSNSDGGSVAAAVAGLISQPVVWTSLYFVKTTGAGLPAGPYGLLGALEGVSYLIVVAFVGASLYRKVTFKSGPPSGSNSLLGVAEGLSYLSILAGLAVLAGLVYDEGCVPNAKPILDYSEYLPVCDAKPGLFGK